jgi:hypothetical protein
MIRALLAAAAFSLASMASAAPAGSSPGPSAPAPTLAYVFSIRVEAARPVEQGEVDGGRRRFIGITGGTVYGPRLRGTVMPGGGDWQTIMPDGLTRLDARYQIKTDDGAVVEVSTPGVRVADPAVVARLAKGEDVDPSLYYFRVSPTFAAPAGKLDWLRRATFVARGIRRPDHVVLDFYIVE